MRDDDWFKPHPDRPAALPRQPKPGEEVWRLRDRDTGRVQTCELYDHSRAGAGWGDQADQSSGGADQLCWAGTVRRGGAVLMPPRPSVREGSD